jgi:hypothetical protein
LAASNNYFRVDGPRLWAEFSVQGGVYLTSGYHDHGVVRDKLADYGAAYGTSTISTTVRPPTITTQPVSQELPSGTAASFSVVAANAGSGTATLSYQWYKDGTAISGATAATYSPTASAVTIGTYYVQVISTGGLVQSNSATLVLGTGTALSITTASPLAGGMVGTSYSQALAATGGSGNYSSWALTSGSLPAGLSLGSAGVLGGTPTAAGTSTFTVQVTDSALATATASLSLTVQEPLAVFLSNYGLSSASDDDDRDGTANVLEFLLGRDPVTADAGVLPVATRTTVGESTSLVMTFFITAQAGNVTWSVQSSPDLATWTTAVDGTAGATITAVDDGDNLKLVTVTIPTTEALLFARLVATAPQ